MVYVDHFTLSQLDIVQNVGILQGQAPEILWASGLNLQLLSAFLLSVIPFGKKMSSVFQTSQVRCVK